MNIGNTRIPVIFVINKIDQVDDKQKLLPYMQQLHEKRETSEIVPVSALTAENMESLENAINQAMPENEFFYPEDQITDRSTRFMVAEIIREKLTLKLGQELPYVATVEIEKYSERPGITEISAIIWVERSGQKAIVIGKQGGMIKSIGELARQDIEKMIESKVHLSLWVKVREGWSDDERAVRSFGYQE
jgi:GTP-binding protein Era